jgi:serpin B
MMRQEGDLRYATADTWQAVELPYADSNLAMWVLVPTDQTTPAELLAPERSPTWRLGWPRAGWTCRCPAGTSPPTWTSFRPLQELGMEVPFDQGADFSGMLLGVWLDQAVHRANITVDEWGTEAAALTGLAFPSSLPPPSDVTIRADRPFAFAIVDTNTGTPLFIGHVADPTDRP